MRWIFVTLILLNVLLFSVQQFGDNHRSEPSSLVQNEAGKVSEIRLLHESSQEGAKPFSRESTKEADRRAPDAQKMCLGVGAFDSLEAGQEFAKFILSAGLQSKTTALEVKKPSDYWVYLEPLESRNAAIRKLRELQVANIDSFLISQGPLSNGISLGLFKNQDSALSLQKDRIAQGYPAKLTEVPRSVTEFWVVLSDPSDGLLTAKVSALIAEKNDQLEQRQILCKSIASK